MTFPRSAGLPFKDTGRGSDMARQEGPGVPAPSMGDEQITLPQIVSHEEWQAARDELLVEEKALMKARDRLAAKRRRLPVTPVRTDYRFVGPEGEVNLLDLFAGRRQLIVYRFFYAPDVENWPDGSCSGCAFFADTVVHPAHLAARDTSLVFVSAAPQERLAHLKARMKWEALPFFTLVGDDFSQGFRGRGDVRAQRLHPRRRSCVSHLLRQRARHRGDRPGVVVARHDAARPAGGLAGQPTRRPQGPPTNGGACTTTTARWRPRAVRDDIPTFGRSTVPRR